MERAKPLSKRQRDILEFVREEIQTRGYAPTVREIVAHVGDKSPTSVHRHLRTLEARGYLIREANKSRSIRLADEHRGMALAGVIAAGSPIQAVEDHLRTLEARGYLIREANKSRSIRLADEHRGMALAGVIAAGSPIQAVEDVERVDLGHMYDPTNHFMLRVRGDSMIEDHIDDGDLIVVRRQKNCRNGDTVVAMVDGENATLKRFYREDGRIRLQPANHSMEPIYPSEVDILGVAVGVIRQMSAGPEA